MVQVDGMLSHNNMHNWVLSPQHIVQTSKFNIYLLLPKSNNDDVYISLGCYLNHLPLHLKGLMHGFASFCLKRLYMNSYYVILLQAEESEIEEKLKQLQVEVDDAKSMLSR